MFLTQLRYQQYNIHLRDATIILTLSLCDIIVYSYLFNDDLFYFTWPRSAKTFSCKVLKIAADSIGVYIVSCS